MTNSALSDLCWHDQRVCLFVGSLFLNVVLLAWLTMVWQWLPFNSSVLVHTIAIAQSASAPALRSEPPSHSTHNDCASPINWRFDSYAPSSWEWEWYSQRKERAMNASFVLAEPTERERTFQFVQRNMELITEPEAAVQKNFKEVEPLYSKYFYSLWCGSQRIATGEQWIEPLIGFLRDPLIHYRNGAATRSGEHIPIAGDGIQSKRWLLPAGNAPFQIHSSIQLSHRLLYDSMRLIDSTASDTANADFLYHEIPNFLLPTSSSRVVIMDLGASYFGGWGDPRQAQMNADATATKWLLAHLPTPDLIIALEYEKLDPHVYWDQIPQQFMGKFMFINHGIEASQDSKYNPWRMLSGMVAPSDYVVVKMDIDNNYVETPLIHQVMEGAFGVDALIDEMFFEHHVALPEMEQVWGTGVDKNATIADTYHIFYEIRKKGIRMHSWP